MVEAVLHFLKIHRKMILGNPTVIVQNMLCKAPKPLNAINMILGFLANQRFRVVDGKVLPEPLQRVVAPEGIGIVDRPFSGFLSDDGHKLLLGHMLHNSRIDLAVALQEAKYNVFTGCTAPALALASAAKVGLIQLHLTVQFAALKLCHMVDRFAQALVDARDRLVVKAKVMRKTVRRLLLIESLHNSDLRAYALQGLLFSTGPVAAPDISTTRLRYSERTAEYALFTPQKVGRAPENVLFCCNHKGIVAPRGYETH